MFVRAGEAYLVTDGQIYAFGVDGSVNTRGTQNSWIDRWLRSVAWEDVAGIAGESVVMLDPPFHCVWIRLEDGHERQYVFSGVSFEELDAWPGGKVIIKTVQAAASDPRADSD